jgi:DNA-binding MarR family transcriptional regulator
MTSLSPEKYAGDDSADSPRGRGFDVATDNSVGYLLRDTAKLLLRDTAAALEPLGISLPQYFVLRELWQEEGLTQRELASRVGVAEPAMVATLDALAHAGLTERVRSAQDRRKVNVGLTARGRNLRDSCLAHSARLLDRALVGISDAEIHAMRDVLHRMKANLEQRS